MENALLSVSRNNRQVLYSWSTYTGTKKTQQHSTWHVCAAAPAIEYQPLSPAEAGQRSFCSQTLLRATAVPESRLTSNSIYWSLLPAEEAYADLPVV